MNPSLLENKTRTHPDPARTWKCSVCGFVITREEPPKGCPKCGSSSAEFLPMLPYEQFTYDGEKFDVLLINGSPHRANNTGYLLDRAE